MDEHERAKQIARCIEDALRRTLELPLTSTSPPLGTISEYKAAPMARFSITKQEGCLSCDPGACEQCGYLFSGERIIIHHVDKGERVLSDKTVHLLSHGTVRYKTKYIIRGEPVVVDLDLDELAGYLDL